MTLILLENAFLIYLITRRSVAFLQYSLKAHIKTSIKANSYAMQATCTLRKNLS